MTEFQTQWQKAEEILKKASKIYIFTHASLDADALGSLFALLLALRKAGYKNTYGILGEKVTNRLAFVVPENDGLYFFADEYTEEITEADVAICVDCANLGRLNDGAMALAEKCGKKIKIDHHLPCENSDFADVNMTNPDWAATGEGLFGLISNNICEIDYEIGIRLYTGILTDTGRFTYSCTTPSTMRALAGLLEILGTDLAWVGMKTYDERTLEAFKLISLAYLKAVVSESGEVIVSAIDYKDFEQSGAEISDSGAIVSELMKVEGVKMAIFVRPQGLEPSETTFRISMRCKEGFDVSSICGAFGGGGHICASGATLKDTTQKEAIEAVLAEAEKQSGLKMPVWKQ